MKLTVAGNTLYPCFFVIKSKGFEITIDEVEEDDEMPMVHAKKGELYFSASSAEELLGLITMYEQRGENWLTWSAEELAMYNEKKLFG